MLVSWRFLAGDADNTVFQLYLLINTVKINKKYTEAHDKTIAFL
jgi:hypothetical protein